MNIFIFLGILFLLTFLVGHVLEKIRIPWIFSALIFGVLLSFHNSFVDITQSNSFQFMSNIGLYLLLFLIGFELNIQKVLKSGKFIIKATILIELAEMVLVGTAVHFLFGISWPISLLLALSFATVGEAILLPMLEEFRMVKTKLGQMILGIATFDDVFEIIVLLSIIFVVPFFIQSKGLEQSDPMLVPSLLLLVALLVILFLAVRWLRKEVLHLKIPNVAAVLPLVLAVFFILVGIDRSEGAHFAILGALCAGIVVKNLLSPHLLEEVEPQIKTITYGLFAPIFFLNIGIETNAHYLLTNFWVIVLITLAAKFAKIGASYIIGRKELGTHQSLFMGVALGVRFSTSIVFLKILLDSQLITSEIYSIMIGTSIFFKFVVPILLAVLAERWHLASDRHT